MAYKKGILKRAFEKAMIPVLGATLIAGAGTALYENYAERDMRVTVTGKTWALLDDDEGVGFTKTVYKTDKGELTNVINPYLGKFTRGGIEKEIQVGKTYDVTVQGIDISWLGYYPNILRATPVPGPDAPK